MSMRTLPASSCCCRTRLLSSKIVRRSSGAGSSPWPHTASIAARVAPPRKIASRRNRTRSAAVSKSWLQSMVARSVCWRGGRFRAPRVSVPSRSSSRANRSAGVNSFKRTAANSRASGSPSNRRQMAAIVPAFASVSSKPGCTACARSRKRRAASLSATVSASAAVPASGTGSGPTRYSCSP